MTDFLLVALGAAISIPIGFAINLATPWARSLFSRYSSRIREATARRNKLENLLIRRLAKEPEARVEVLAHLRFMMHVDLFFFGLITLIATGGAAQSSGFSPLLLAIPTLGVGPVISYFARSRRYYRIQSGIFKINNWPNKFGWIWSTEQRRWVPLTDEEDASSTPSLDQNGSSQQVA